MTSSSVQLSDWSVPSGVASALSREAACTGVVSAEDGASALSSLKGLWRCVGLLTAALLPLASEVVERGQLSVSVRSPSAGTRREERINASSGSWMEPDQAKLGAWGTVLLSASSSW